jgi:hypothetical protein
MAEHERRMYTANMPLHPFLFMGCWNKPSKGHHAVLQAILDRPESVLILGGDNAYSDKQTQVMNYAFVFGEHEKLRTKETFVALGNHNLNDPATLRQEKKYHNDPSMHWHMPDNYYCYTFQDGYAIVVLDTSPLHFWPQASYRGVDLTFLPAMLAWLQQTLTVLQSKKIPYYLVQHDPIVAHKHSSVRYLQEGTRILQAIANYPPKCILSADIHNFQEGLLEYNGTLIKQYVAGTGGGDPYDIYPVVRNAQKQPRYYLERFTSGYGFLRVQEDWKKPVEFVKVQEWPNYTPRPDLPRILHPLALRTNTGPVRRNAHARV